MAKDGSSSRSPPPTFTVFVDTSLDTHLAMVVSRDDTVGELKGKIRIEHTLCFPSIGEITVKSMKVRRRGFFYHLSDSMLVKNSFDGINGTWFLYMDAISACRQDGTAENVMNQNGGQSQKHQLPDTEPNASISNDHFVPDDSKVDASLHMNISTKVLQDDRCMSLPESEKRSDADLPELPEPVLEGNVAVGSHLEPKINQAVDQGEKDGREEDHGNLDAKAYDGFVFIKKEKSRKRSDVSQNDPLLEKDASYVEKKKHKKKWHGSSEEPCGYSKRTSKLENTHPDSSAQEKHEKNPVSSELLCSDSLPKTLTSDEKKKKQKKKKKGTSLFDDNNASAIPESGSSDRLLDKTVAVASFRKQVAEVNPGEAFISNHRNAGKESDAALILDKVTRNVTNADSVEVDTTDPLSTSLKSSDSNAVVTLQGAAQHGNPAEVYSDVPTNSSHRKKKAKSESSRNALSKFASFRSSGDHFNEGDLEEASGNNKKDLNEESDAMATIGEPVDRRTPAGDSEVPSNVNVRSSNCSRRKKSDKTEVSNPQSHTYRAIHSSGEQVSEDDPKETPGCQPRDSDKESKLGEAVVLGNAAVEDSITPSNPNERSSRHKRKKAAKAELKEPSRSLMKGATEEDPKETLVGIDKHQGKESKSVTVLGEAALLESPAGINLAIPSNPNDRNSRQPKRKKGKVYSSINHDLDHSSGNQCLQENLQKAPEITHRDSGNESNDSATPDETAKNLAHGNHIGEENTEGLLEKTRENSGEDCRQNVTHRRHAESIEINDHMDLPKSDSDKVNFMEFFVPKDGQLESLASAQAVETETRKSHKDKIKRKRKSKIHSEDSTHDLVNPPSSDELHMLKKKPQDSEPGNHGFVDSVVQLTAKEHKAKKPHDEKTAERSTSDVHLGDTSSGLGATRNLHDNNMIEKKPQVHDTDKPHQISSSNHEQSKHLKEKTSTISERNHKSISYPEGNNIMDSADENRHPKNFDASIRSSPVVEPVTQNHSSACADVSMEETIASLAASSDTTEEDTSYQRKRYRLAVRKAPSKRFGKNMNNTDQEKTLPTPGTIFNDTISASSEDEFEFVNRKATSKTVSDNSSASAGSDGNLEETPITSLLKPQNSAGVDSAVHVRNNGVSDIILTQPSSVAKKSSRPLSKILRSASSYRKAKQTASQSQQLEDSESQPVCSLGNSTWASASP